MATVLAGLAFFALLALPLLLWAVTGRSPLAVARAFAQSLLMAFGTSSSAAALPLAMQVGTALNVPAGGGAGRQGRVLPVRGPACKFQRQACVEGRLKPARLPARGSACRGQGRLAVVGVGGGDMGDGGAPAVAPHTWVPA